MVTWGAGIMDSDLALEVRAEFRERVANGMTGDVAARSLVREWRAGFDDREEGAAMWLALADAAWEAGRLPASVKTKAMALARDPMTVEPFALGGLGAERRAALAKLVAKLEKNPPEPARILPRKKRETELGVGELLVYTLPTGDRALLWVVALGEVEVLDFVGKRVPTAEELRTRGLPVSLARFSVADLVLRHDPGQRYYVWPEKYAPRDALPAGSTTRLGPELEKRIMRVLGVRRALPRTKSALLLRRARKRR